VAYTVIFGFGSYYLAKLLRKGPEPLEEAVRGADFGDRLDRKPKRPFSVPDESLEGNSGHRTQPAR
jgi:cytochrome d ubiquinol oxidase subunit I